jgi:hypothetical protein
MADMATMTRTNATDNVNTIQFRPTLVVGLGGSGHEVVVRLKASLMDAFGERVFDIVKLLVFDTADEPTQVPNARGELVNLEKGTELVNIGGVPVPAIKANLDRQPTIKSWLPPDLPVRALTAGASQVRPLGRLAFFHHFMSIRSILQSRIMNLRNIRLQGPLGTEGLVAADTQGINAWIISSVSGGTGSGTFIDMAYLVRHLCIANGIGEQFSFINAMLVLPQAFAQVTSDAIRANAYAALRELDYYMANGNFNVEYPNRETITVGGKPFNICYLVDTVNERGSNLAGLNELAPMMADAMMVQIGSQVGTANTARFDNVKSLSGMDSGHTTAYSGVGIASIAFPAKKIVEVCANQLSAQLISKELLIERADNERLRSEIKGFVESNQFDRQRLLVELSRAPNKQIIVIGLQDALVADAGADELLSKVKQYMTQYEAQSLNTTFTAALENNRKVLKQQLGDDMRASIERLIDNPEFGIPAASAFIDAMRTHIETMTADMTQERLGLGDRLAANRKQSEGAETELKDAIGGFPIGRAGRINKARPAYLNVRQQGFQLQFEMSKRSQAIALLADLNVLLSEQRKRVSALEDRLNTARLQSESNIARTTVARDRFSSPLIYDITTPKDVDEYYRANVQDLGLHRTQLLESTAGLASWLDKSQDEINALLLNYGRDVFAIIWDIQIEGVLTAKRGEMSPDERLQILRRDSSPFWNYEGPRMEDGGNNLESIKVIGVADASSSIYKGKELTNEELASTHDYRSLTVLHTRHGLPLFALQQYPDYRQKYKIHMQRKVSPVQLFNHINISDDEGEREARMTFALSEAFGYIKANASFYTCRTSDELAVERQLGQGLRKAVESFTEKQDLVREMDRVIQQRIRELGLSSSVKVIDDYIKLSPTTAPNPSDKDALMIDLRKLAREYRERLMS